jgi:hypothetical protein
MKELEDTVRTKVQEAFETTPYPGDEKLVAAGSSYDPESEEIAEVFKGKHWSDVPLGTLREHGTALPLLTPAAFRYYLPSFMIGYIDSYYELDAARDAVLFNLTPPKGRSGAEWNFFWERAQLFNEQEIEAIRAFLTLVERYERADWASEGIEPPEDRVGPAIAFWADHAASHGPNRQG